MPQTQKFFGLLLSIPAKGRKRTSGMQCVSCGSALRSENKRNIFKVSAGRSFTKRPAMLCALLLMFLGSSALLRAQNFNPNGFDAAKTMQEILNPHDDLVIVSSHRGDHALVNGLYTGIPENSLQAIGQAAQDGAEEIELDVKLTSDGVPILSHDLSWGREWCGLPTIIHRKQHFNPFQAPGDSVNDSVNPLVSATSLGNTRSYLGTTVLRDTISLVTDTTDQGCTVQRTSYGEYPPTLQDALNYMTANKIAMVLALDIRDARTANAAWQVINNGYDYLGRNYLLETLFKVPAKAFATPSDVEVALPAGPSRYPAYFQPVYNTGDIAPGPMPQNQLDFGGTDVNSADTGYGSESEIIHSLQGFENDANITVAAVELQIKQIGGILTSVLSAAKTNSRTGLRESVTVFSPYVDYYAPSDTGHTDPLFFKTTAFCCVRLSDFYYDGTPNGQPSDTDDKRGDLNYLLQQGFNSITYDNPAGYTARLAALGKRNIGRLQGGITKRSIVPLRVMPTGDSITEGFQSNGNGYRYQLQQDIQNQGQTVAFVGVNSDGPMTNPQNEGFSAKEIAYIASQAVPYAAECRPNVALILAGTNDLNGADDVANAPGRLDSMVSGLFNSAPDATMLVAGIPPTVDPILNSLRLAFNASVQGLVSNRRNAGQHVAYVNMNNLDPNADMADSLHPNPAGYQIMGDNFAGAIEEMMNRGWVTAPVAASCTVVGKSSGTPGTAKKPVGQQPGLGTMTSLGKIADGIGADPKTSFLRFADLNGDGRADYLSINSNGSVSGYLNAGIGTNGGVVWLPTGVNGLIAGGIGEPGANVRFADINGDGRADYLTINANGAVRAYLNAGLGADGSWVWLPAPYPNQVIAGGIGAPGSSIQFGDINGDGLADYLSVDANGAVTGYLNGGPNPDGSGWIWYPIAGQIAGGVGAPKGSKYQFADINNDGWDDYIVIDAVNGTVHAWLNAGRKSNGDWNWVPQGQIAPGNGAASRLHIPVLADLNGDGRADYLAINPRGSVNAWLNNGKDTSPVAGWLPLGPIANASADLRWADIDGDGLADYIHVDLTTGAASAYLNGGQKPDGSWIWFPQNQIAAGECGGIKNCYVEFGDIDGDGKADYLVGDYTTGQTSAWLSGGAATGGGWVWYPQGTAQIDFTLAAGTVIQWVDLNNDGFADMVMTSPDGITSALQNLGPGAGGWTSGNRLGGIGNISNGPTQANGYINRFGDINNDGRADLLSVLADGSVAVTLNQGGASIPIFNGSESIIASGVGAPGSQIQLADINGDGRVDYLIVPPTGQVTAWLNNGGPYIAQY